MEEKFGSFWFDMVGVGVIGVGGFICEICCIGGMLGGKWWLWGIVRKEMIRYILFRVIGC